MNGAPKVWLSGVSIPNGGADDVGNQAPTTIHLSYTVDNSAGTDQLSITDVTAEDLVNVSNFSLLTATPINIPAGETGSFDIAFDVDALGAFSLEMRIASNDLDENPYGVQITGIGAAVPEINVQGGGQDILNGDTNPQTADHSDFGSADENDATITRTFTIQNTGSVDLNLTADSIVTIGGPQAAEFELTADATTPVAAGGGVTTFQISFDPRGEGLRQATVSIANDDNDENPYTFNILGTGAAAEAAGGDGDDTDETPGELIAGVGASGGMFKFVRVRVTIPQGTLDAYGGCQISIGKKGGNIGFAEYDPVYDVSITCAGGPPTTYNPPLEVCIKPTTAQLDAAGAFANLQLFHSHSGEGWKPVFDTYEQDGYLCAQMWTLGYFTLHVPEIPDTGFPPGVITVPEAQPAEKGYAEMGDYTLEIPALGSTLPIVGVPLTEQGWDVTWLGAAAGYLEGTADPTWPGNTAITAHVWDANNNPGPFVNLHTLGYGDEIIIHAWGLTHTYEVRAVEQVIPDNLRALPHSDYDVLTLITCNEYDESEGEYNWRLAVRAVLVDVETER